MVPVNDGLASVAPVIVDVHSGTVPSDFTCKTLYSELDPIASFANELVVSEYKISPCVYAI